MERKNNKLLQPPKWRTSFDKLAPKMERKKTSRGEFCSSSILLNCFASEVLFRNFHLQNKKNHLRKSSRGDNSLNIITFK